jgi:hypothetical protein
MEMMEKKTITYLDTSSDEQCHELWPTPVVTARPFTEEFLCKLEEDVKYLLKPGAPGTFNKTNLWDLPDLPDTMLAVKDKFLELTEKHYRPSAEMPLPPLFCSKGYFREVKANGVYRISPHKHAQTLGVGILYLTIPERNAGNLIMLDPRGGVLWHNQFTPFKRVKVERGLVLIHPGYMTHFVEPTDYENSKYDYRLAIISNIHWRHADFIKELEKNEEAVLKMGSIEI